MTTQIKIAIFIFALFFMVSECINGYADMDDVNNNHGRLIDDIPKQSGKQSDKSKKDEDSNDNLRRFLQTFKDEDNVEFECDILCEGFTSELLTVCMKVCEDAGKQIRQNRQQVLCEKPENMEMV